jgi:uncharacterized membrane protein YsdA (DUF1294 family)
MGRSGSRVRPEVYHAGLGLLLALAVALALLLAFRTPWTWDRLLLAWLAGINLTAFAYHGHDKGRARRGGRRVPEVSLHALTLVGGSLGAYAGMRLFRHKTVKGSFRVVFWFIVVAPLALVLAVGYRLWRRRHAGGPASGPPAGTFSWHARAAGYNGGSWPGRVPSAAEARAPVPGRTRHPPDTSSSSPSAVVWKNWKPNSTRTPFASRR